MLFILALLASSIALPLASVPASFNGFTATISNPADKPGFCKYEFNVVYDTATPTLAATNRRTLKLMVLKIDKAFADANTVTGLDTGFVCTFNYFLNGGGGVDIGKEEESACAAIHMVGGVELAFKWEKGVDYEISDSCTMTGITNFNEFNACTVYIKSGKFEVNDDSGYVIVINTQTERYAIWDDHSTPTISDTNTFKNFYFDGTCVDQESA